MTPIVTEWERTWEEIAAHKADFAGRRLHVQVLPAAIGSEGPRLQILRESEARSQAMNPKPDTRKHGVETRVHSSTRRSKDKPNKANNAP